MDSPGVVARTLARNRLGTVSAGLFALAHEAPLLVVAGVVTTGFAVTGHTGVSLALPLLAAVLALFSVGYTAMGRRVANAGAFPSYTAGGLGRVPAVAAGGVALVAYNCLQFGLYGLLGVSAEPLLQQAIGFAWPWWQTAGIAWLVIAVLGASRIDLNRSVLAVLILAELAFLAVSGTASLLNPAGGEVTVDMFHPQALFGAGAGAGALLVLAFLAMVGFESPTVYSEESRDPARTVRRAIIGSLAVVGVIYTFAVWALVLGTGSDTVVARSREAGPDLLFQVAEVNLGITVANIGRALIVASIFAGALAFHNTTARQFYALGREGVLPTRLGVTSRNGAPRNGSLLQSVIGLTVLVVVAAAGLKPVEHLFYWAGNGGGYGILLLVTATNIAVLTYFRRHPNLESVWTRLLAPGISLLALCAVTYLATTGMGSLLGLPPGSPGGWAIPGAYLAVITAGLLYGLYVRRYRPDVYARIGLGAKTTQPAAVPAVAATAAGSAARWGGNR